MVQSGSSALTSNTPTSNQSSYPASPLLFCCYYALSLPIFSGLFFQCVHLTFLHLLTSFSVLSTLYVKVFVSLRCFRDILYDPLCFEKDILRSLKTSIFSKKCVCSETSEDFHFFHFCPVTPLS